MIRLSRLVAPAVLILSLGAVQPAPAASYDLDKYDLDKPHTQIMFAVDHLGFTQSHGRFLGYDGSFFFDHLHPEKSSVAVTIHTGTLDMGDKLWNEHTLEFFHADKYPDMTFKSTGVKVTSDKTADITGDLTLLGVTKPVVLHTTFNKEGRDPFGKYDAGFTAQADIKRSDFGMKDFLPAVGDDVHITIEAEGNREDKPGQQPYNQ